MLNIHTLTSSEAGLMSNTYLVEAPESIVVVDPPMLVPDARAVSRAVAALDKPVSAILYTHPHPDHVNGATVIRGDSNAPVFATRDTDAVSRLIDGPKREFWTATFGDDYPPVTTFATHLVDEGMVEVGPVRFSVHNIGPGECETGSVWVLHEADSRSAFIGDLAYNNVHPWLFEGRSRRWIDQLSGAASFLTPAATLYPGHGKPGDIGILRDQADYIRAYQDAARALSGGSSSLTEQQKQELTRRMAEVWPTAPLTALIAMSADPVASELSAAR